jgi:flagellin
MAQVDVTRIASNVGALNALNSLQQINAKLAMHQQRLSTGKRINSAADDPAGLTIATKMMARSEGLKASIDNISDARNMLSVAEGGLSTMTDIMIAMRSKAEKAASDTLGTSERATIQTQLSSYAQQIQDLVDQTKWNGVKLLDNSTGAKVFQTGVDEGETTTWTLPGALVPGPTGLNLSKKVSVATATAVLADGFQNVTGLTPASPVEVVAAASGLSELSTGDYSLNVMDKAASTLKGKTNLDANSTLVSGLTSLGASATSDSTLVMTSGQYELKIIAATSDTTTQYEIKNLTDTKWNGGSGKLTVVADLSTATGTSGNLVEKNSASGAGTGNLLGVNLGIGSGGASELNVGQVMKFEYIAKGDARVELKDAIGTSMTVSQYDATGAVSGYGTYSYANTITAGATSQFQSGRGVQFQMDAFANVKVGNTQGFTYEKMSNWSVNVSNTSKAGAYLTTVNTALDRVTSALSDLGAMMSRLSFKEEQANTAQVNVEGAYSRIMNANMAEEQVNASKYTILQQTATAMLAQANAAPQSLLTLFR